MATLPQTLTPYHAKYYAYELTRRCPPDSDDRLANALVDAQVDLNPHQIDAALFSFKSPLSRDRAGRQGIKRARDFDRSILEYWDLFRLFPIMPLHSDRDPTSLQKSFETDNAAYKGLDWELEDLLPQSFCDAFAETCPGGVVRKDQVEGRVHRELMRDAKAKFHRFIRDNAMHDDLGEVIAVLRAMRFYIGIKDS